MAFLNAPTNSQQSNHNLVQQPVGQKDTHLRPAAFYLASRSVHIPVVQRQRHIAYRVSEVPDNKYATLASEGSQAWDIEELARVVLDTRKEEDGSRGSVCIDNGLDVFGRKDILVIGRFEGDHRVFWA
ncbi:hypothetical protein HG530_000682 [Fusarium avenaceum]|nr:hypothetical protein HG530_000682 [Fusarium avenaceum]